MTGTESIQRLVQSGNTSDFALSLIAQFNRRRRLSDKQWTWVQKLSDEAAEKAAAPKPATVEIGGFDQMIELFDKATANGLKWPKVRLDAGDDRVVISRCGPKAKHPGALRVTNGSAFGSTNNMFFGFVHKDGQLERGRDCNAAVIEVLRDFAADPAAVASAYGQRTGACCFCSKELTDGRSVSVGYGPICADKYALPWG